MYQSILVPLDGSRLAEAILPEIEKLAALLKARLNLIRVSRVHVLPGVNPSEAQIKAVRRAQEYLESLKKRLSTRDIEIEIHAAYGNPAEKILEVCRRHDIDLIAMSTHGRSGLGRWLLGSVAEKVVRHSEKPVLLLRAHETDVGSSESLNEINKQRLMDAINRSNGNQSEAARLLGISRTSVWNQVKRFNIKL